MKIKSLVFLFLILLTGCAQKTTSPKSIAPAPEFRVENGLPVGTTEEIPSSSTITNFEIDENVTPPPPPPPPPPPMMGI